MIKGIGHLGIVVKDIENSLEALSRIIEFERPAVKEFPDKKMRCAVVQTKGVFIEFLQDNSDNGFMARFNRERGDAIHHFCVLSDDVEQDVEALKKKGVEMMDPMPRIGLRGRRLQ